MMRRQTKVEEKCKYSNDEYCVVAFKSINELNNYLK